MKKNPLTCQHYWVSTKGVDEVQCIYCGQRKEVEPVEPEHLPPPEEYEESL